MLRAKIAYPYLPLGRTFFYVDQTNRFMDAAREFALKNSLDTAQPTGSVVVSNDKIIGYGANGSDYHKEFPCVRVLQGIPTGQGYKLCEGCHPKNHSEPRAITKAGPQTNGSDLYLWGHWWCCEPCWQAITAAGIKRVFLVRHSEVIFNRAHAKNTLPAR